MLKCPIIKLKVFLSGPNVFEVKPQRSRPTGVNQCDQRNSDQMAVC